MSDSAAPKPRETPAERSARLSAVAKSPRRNRLGALPDASSGSGNDEAAENGRLFSISDTARLMNRNKKSVMDWIDAGAPVAGRQGASVMIDLAAMIDWRELRARQKAERRSGATLENPGDADGPKLTVKEKIALDKLDMQKMDKAAKAGILVGRPAAEAVFERAMGIVRQAVMGVPERIVREMAGFPEAKKLEWRGKAQEHCRSALAEASKDIAKLLPGMRKAGK